MTAGLLRGLVPPNVSVEETFGAPQHVRLFPEEHSVIAGAVEKRRREFVGARFCARSALRQLGLPAVPLLPGSGGAPTWPEGVVGSITHCDGYCASAVASARDVLAIGIDAEPATPLPGGILEAVALPDEHEAVDALSARSPQVPWDRLLFSAKESVYKAWYPLTGTWLDFHEARVSFRAQPGSDHGTFTADLLRPVPPSCPQPILRFTGSWAMAHGFVATAVNWLRHDRAAEGHIGSW